MPTHTDQRLAIARSMAAVYAAHPEVRAILVGGSVARGLADQWSDIDLMVYRDQVDAAALEPAPLAHLGDRFTFTSLYPGTCTEQYKLGELKVDVGHITRAYAEEMLQRGHDALDFAPEVQGT